MRETTLYGHHDSVTMWEKHADADLKPALIRYPLGRRCTATLRISYCLLSALLDFKLAGPKDNRNTDGN